MASNFYDDARIPGGAHHSIASNKPDVDQSTGWGSNNTLPYFYRSKAINECRISNANR